MQRGWAASAGWLLINCLIGSTHSEKCVISLSLKIARCNHELAGKGR